MRLVPKKFGLVEIFYDGIWWNVCADSEWDRRDALVACRQRGFPSGLPHRQPICPWNAVNCHSKFGRFKCTGTEATLEECEFTTEDLTNTWTCRDGFAVVECLYDEPDGDWFDGFNLTDSSIFNSTAVPIVTKKKYSGTYKITGIARIFEGVGGGGKHKTYKGCLKGTFIYTFCSKSINRWANFNIHWIYDKQKLVYIDTQWTTLWTIWNDTARKRLFWAQSKLCQFSSDLPHFEWEFSLCTWLTISVKCISVHFQT